MAFFQENHKFILTVMEQMATPTKTHPSKLPVKYVLLVENQGKTKKSYCLVLYKQREHDQMQCGKAN